MLEKHEVRCMRMGALVTVLQDSDFMTEHV